MRVPIEWGAWVEAKDLVPGDRLQNPDGTWAQVVSLKITQTPLTAYNLTVETDHTYFVAANLDAEPVWVHNCPEHVYVVPGERTASGKPYAGQSSKDSPSLRPGNGRDGRVREDDDMVVEMPGSTRREREIEEQKQVNELGGLDYVDNKQNPVREEKWEEYGIPAPKAPRKQHD